MEESYSIYNIFPMNEIQFVFSKCPAYLIIFRMHLHSALERLCIAMRGGRTAGRCDGEPGEGTCRWKAWNYSTVNIGILYNKFIYIFKHFWYPHCDHMMMIPVDLLLHYYIELCPGMHAR